MVLSRTKPTTPPMNMPVCSRTRIIWSASAEPGTEYSKKQYLKAKRFSPIKITIFSNFSYRQTVGKR